MTESASYEYAICVKKKRAVKKSSSSTRRVKRRSTFELKGISKTVVLVIVAIVLVAGGGFYFITQRGGGVSNPLSSMMGKALNPNCEYKDPDLCKFFNNFKELENYSMMTTSKSGGTTMESKFESQGKDKSHIVSSESGKENMNMITIGDTTYTKDFSDNKWFKHTYKPDPNITPIKAESDVKDTFDDKKQIEDKTEYKAQGKEACGNLTCFKYQVVSPQDDGATTYIWFDDREYMLRKQTTTDKDGNSTESTFAYDAVSITEPSPVKEGEPGIGNIPGMTEEDKKAIQDAQKSMQNIQSNPSSDYTPPADSSSGDNGDY